MSTVDEILATGRYEDRRGREWFCGIAWSNGDSTWYSSNQQFIRLNEMRLLIERDQHRDECEGLRACGNHPVPHVTTYPCPTAYVVWDSGGETDDGIPDFRTLPEAMDAARALAANP